MADIKARVKSFVEAAHNRVPSSVSSGASQLGGGVQRIITGASQNVASGLEKIGASGLAERAQNFGSAVETFQTKRHTGTGGVGNVAGIPKLTGSRVLGYGAMGGSLLAAGAVGAGLGAAVALASTRKPEEQSQRMAGDRPIVGGNIMPADLQAGYMNLATPGSPLGGMGLLAGNHLRQGQVVQDALVADQHRMRDMMLTPIGQLPVGYMQSKQGN